MKHLTEFLTSKSEEKPLMVLDSILVYLFKTYYTSTTKIEVKEFLFNRHKTILDVYNVYISIVLTVVGLLLGLYIGK